MSFVSEPGVLVLFLPLRHRAVDVTETFTPLVITLESKAAFGSNTKCWPASQKTRHLSPAISNFWTIRYPLEAPCISQY